MRLSPEKRATIFRMTPCQFPLHATMFSLALREIFVGVVCLAMAYALAADDRILQKNHKYEVATIEEDDAYVNWHDGALLNPLSLDARDDRTVYCGSREPRFYCPPNETWKANQFSLYNPKHDRFYSGAYVEYGSHLLFPNPTYHNPYSFVKRQEARRKSIQEGTYTDHDSQVEHDDEMLMKAMKYLSLNSSTTGIISVPSYGVAFVNDTMTMRDARRRWKEGSVAILRQDEQTGLVSFTTY